MIILLSKYKWYVGLILILLLLLLLINISTYSNNSQFAEKKPFKEASDIIHNDLVDIILDDKAPRAIAAIISSEGILDIASAGVRKVGSDVAFTCDNVVHLGSCTKAMTTAMLATLVADSDSELGASIVGGIEKGISGGDRFFIEAKLGLVDAPDLKITVGWTFGH